MRGKPVEQQGYFGKHVLRDVAARRSRIGDELRLIELLHEVERLLCREAVLRVRFLLERGQVVQQRRVLHLFLLFGFHDGGAHLCLYVII